MLSDSGRVAVETSQGFDLCPSETTNTAISPTSPKRVITCYYQSGGQRSAAGKCHDWARSFFLPLLLEFLSLRPHVLL